MQGGVRVAVYHVFVVIVLFACPHLHHLLIFITTRTRVVQVGQQQLLCVECVTNVSSMNVRQLKEVRAATRYLPDAARRTRDALSRFVVWRVPCCGAVDGKTLLSKSWLFHSSRTRLIRAIPVSCEAFVPATNFRE